MPFERTRSIYQDASRKHTRERSTTAPHKTSLVQTNTGGDTNFHMAWGSNFSHGSGLPKYMDSVKHTAIWKDIQNVKKA